MQYAILCYNDEAEIGAWTKEEDDACMARLAVVQEDLARRGKLGPVARLLPTTTATTLRKDREPPLVIDGPFAETKEQLLGFYIVEADSLDEALDIARDLGRANPGGSYEIRPLSIFRQAPAGGMTDPIWMERTFAGVRPQAVSALLRYFRDLDIAEEAFQEGVPQGPFEMATERTAARSGGLADLRRAQCRDRWRSPPQPGAGAAGRGPAFRSRGSRERNRRGDGRRRLSRRHPPPDVHLLSPRPARHAADRARAQADFRSLGIARRARLPGQRKRDGAAYHPRQAQGLGRPVPHSRHPARPSVPNASPPW